LRWLGKLDEGRRRARAERRNLVVWVTASWSAEAQRIERDVLPSHDIGPLLAPFVLVKVDVSDANEANEATMLELEVDTVPALVVLDDSGREVTRAGPMLDVESVRTALRSTD
jgi:thiol:disulfide interchange protein